MFKYKKIYKKEIHHSKHVQKKLILGGLGQNLKNVYKAIFRWGGVTITFTVIYIYIYIHIQTYMYLYIYRERESYFIVH